MKLIPIPKRSRELLAALRKNLCAEICLAIMSPNDRWKNFSDVYYALVSQTRLPWATYSKLTTYLAANGFVEKSSRTTNNRKSISLKLTPLGKDLVKMYVSLLGKGVEDLEPELERQKPGEVPT
jgi:predicted transcriptional regulator